MPKKKKAPKGRSTKRAPLKDLTVSDAKTVRGGTGKTKLATNDLGPENVQK